MPFESGTDVHYSSKVWGQSTVFVNEDNIKLFINTLYIDNIQPSIIQTAYPSLGSRG